MPTRCCAAVRRRPGVRYPVLVPNLRGLERALQAGADAVAVFTAASDAFTRANIAMTIAESLLAFAPVLERARAEGMWRRGYVSTAFGCPYQGTVEPAVVAGVAAALLRARLRAGVDRRHDRRRPARAGASRSSRAVPRSVPVERLALHLHDTGGRALENVAAGLEAGVRVFDSSAGGLGGCPFAPGAPGNLATEALVGFLHERGYETGVDLEAVRAAGRMDAHARGRITVPGTGYHG